MSRPSWVVELKEMTAPPPDAYSFTFPESGLLSTALDAVVKIHFEESGLLLPVDPCIPLGPVDIVISPYLSVVLQGQQGLGCFKCVGGVSADVRDPDVTHVELRGTTIEGRLTTEC